MTLHVPRRRSSASLRLCSAAARLAFALASIVAASGCATLPSSGTFIEIRPSEGNRWIARETVESYGCESGVLACMTSVGRLSERRCQCGAVP